MSLNKKHLDIKNISNCIMSWSAKLLNRLLWFNWKLYLKPRKIGLLSRSSRIGGRGQRGPVTIVGVLVEVGLLKIVKKDERFSIGICDCSRLTLPLCSIPLESIRLSNPSADFLRFHYLSNISSSPTNGWSSHLQPKVPEGQRALESLRAPRNRRGLEGWRAGYKQLASQPGADQKIQFSC